MFLNVLKGDLRLGGYAVIKMRGVSGVASFVTTDKHLE